MNMCVPGPSLIRNVIVRTMHALAMGPLLAIGKYGIKHLGLLAHVSIVSLLIKQQGPLDFSSDCARHNGGRLHIWIEPVNR